MQSQTEHMERFIGTAEEYQRQEDQVMMKMNKAQEQLTVVKNKLITLYELKEKLQTQSLAKEETSDADKK